LKKEPICGHKSNFPPYFLQSAKVWEWWWKYESS